MTKFLHLGMTLGDVVRLSTQAPAATMGLSESLGTLKVGAAADVTIVSPDEGRFTLTDSVGVSVEARSSLSHVRTIRDGRIYRPWTSLPPSAFTAR